MAATVKVNTSAWRSSHSIAEDQRPQQMPVALALILGAMAQERDVADSGEPLDEAKREFLAVILDGAASLIDRPVQEKLVPIRHRKPGPRQRSSLALAQDPLARAKARHPHIVAGHGQAATTKSRGENPEPIGLSVDGRPYGLGLEHRGESVLLPMSSQDGRPRHTLAGHGCSSRGKIMQRMRWSRLQIG